MDGVERFVDVAHYVVPAAITTLVVAAISFPGALLVASIVTVPRVQRVPVLSWAADQYVDFVSGSADQPRLGRCAPIAPEG